MIQIEKANIPISLIEKLACMASRFLDLLSANEEIPASLANGYNDPELKRFLKFETAEKCAYCESKFLHVDYGDIEHIESKSARPDLRFDYKNLTLACGVCNTKKGTYHNPALPLLHPYKDDPAEHLLAFGSMVIRHPQSDRGLVTQKRLDLNRPSLVERRAERLEAIASMVDQISRASDPAIKQVLLDQVEQECGPDKEFAFVVRAYVNRTRSLWESSSSVN